MQDNSLALELWTTMSDFYTSEEVRAHQTRELLAKYDIHLVQTMIEGTTFWTDGDIRYKSFRYVIAEIKK
jgi:hypothetical protein